MIHGTVGTYRHTMATDEAKLLTAFYQSRKSILTFEFDYSRRALCDADTIPLTFFVIDIQ
jgi:hypothetical protein